MKSTKPKEMKENLIFFMLSAVLLIKQSLGETENNSPSTNELTANGKAFRDAAISKFSTLSDEPIKLGKKLLEDLYADKSNNENVTRILGESLRYFERIDLNKPAGKVEAFLPFILIFDVVNGRVSINDEANIEADVLLAFKETLEKHNYASVANEFQQKFDEFLEWLTQELQAKSDKLTSEEQLRVKAFIELCLEFKNATNLAKKDNALRVLIRRVKW